MSEPGFWDDNEKAQMVIQKSNEIKAVYDTFHQLELQVEEVELLFEMYKEDPEEEIHEELVELVHRVERELEKYELSM